MDTATEELTGPEAVKASGVELSDYDVVNDSGVIETPFRRKVPGAVEPKATDSPEYAALQAEIAELKAQLPQPVPEDSPEVKALKDEVANLRAANADKTEAVANTTLTPPVQGTGVSDTNTMNTPPSVPPTPAP